MGSHSGKSVGLHLFHQLQRYLLLIQKVALISVLNYQIQIPHTSFPLSFSEINSIAANINTSGHLSDVNKSDRQAIRQYASIK